MDEDVENQMTCLMSQRQVLNPALTLKSHIIHMLLLAYVRLERESGLTQIYPSHFGLGFLKLWFKMFFTLARSIRKISES